MSLDVIDNNFSSSNNKKGDNNRLYQTPEIAFCKHTIELIRNDISYQAINYSSIQQIEVFEGYLVKNRFAVILINIILLISAGYFITSSIYSVISSQELSDINWIQKDFLLTFWAPIIIAIVAITSIFHAFSKSPIVLFKLDKPIRITIKEIADAKQFDELLDFLSSKVKVINHYNDIY